mgnify:CR=1 FL=1
MMSANLSSRLTKLKLQISTIIVGKTTQIDDALACLLAGVALVVLARDYGVPVGELVQLVELAWSDPEPEGLQA